MISYIRGDLLYCTEDTVVIDVNGIGYEIYVTRQALGSLQFMNGQVELYTYLQVKEDGVALFGFTSKRDLRVFKLLITVSGIGPKGALAILSYMSTSELIMAVLAEDSKTISGTPGIGAKTAGKLVIELKDKFTIEDTLGDFKERTGGEEETARNGYSDSVNAEEILTGDAVPLKKTGSGAGNKKDSVRSAKTAAGRDRGQSDADALARNEAVQALVALGYSASDAMRGIRQVEHPEGMSTEELLMAALKMM